MSTEARDVLEILNNLDYNTLENTNYLTKAYESYTNNILKLDSYMEAFGEEVYYANNPERCRVIMLNPEGNCVAFIRRTRNGKVYYTLPGGGREEGENCLDTINREIGEELSLRNYEYRINSKRVLVKEGVYSRERKGERYCYWIYTAIALSNEIKMNGEELYRDKSIYGEYEAVWVPIANLRELNTSCTSVKDMFFIRFHKKPKNIYF